MLHYFNKVKIKYLAADSILEGLWPIDEDEELRLSLFILKPGTIFSSKCSIAIEEMSRSSCRTKYCKLDYRNYETADKTVLWMSLKTLGLKELERF